VTRSDPGNPDGGAPVHRDVQVDPERVRKVAGSVKDPEVRTSIAELGLLDEVEVDGGRVTVRFHLTSPLCPAKFAGAIGQGIVTIAEKLRPSSVEQIKRVFVNLIDNALDALDRVDDERVITITTNRDVETGMVRAEVADSGQGIAPADFRRLFEPYFSRRDSGTGLGLAIVQRIILEHRGKIRAEKNEPRGAKFVIELPVTHV